MQERFYDRTLRGLDWQALREQYRPLDAAAPSAEARAVLINRLLSALGASHTRHYTPAEPAYCQLLDIFSGTLQHELSRLFPDGEVSYVGIGMVTRQLIPMVIGEGAATRSPAQSP